MQRQDGVEGKGYAQRTSRTLDELQLSGELHVSVRAGMFEQVQQPGTGDLEHVAHLERFGGPIPSQARIRSSRAISRWLLAMHIMRQPIRSCALLEAFGSAKNIGPATPGPTR